MTAERNLAQLQVQQLKSSLKKHVHTTSLLIEQATDVIANYFTKAPISPTFWLDDAERHQVWSDDESWKKYNILNKEVGETNEVQPMFSSNGALYASFPVDSPWTINDTHKQHVLGMSHDVTLFLKTAVGSAIGIGAVIELTGHDDSVKDYPSTVHKSKFIRDLLRVRSKSGGNRVVHGCVTDLARIVAVCLMGIGDDGTPILRKTAVLTGDDVRRVLSAFAFAEPSSVGVNVARYDVVMEENKDVEDAAPVTFVPMQHLGSGAQGRVFEAQSNAAESLFLKVHNDFNGFQREVAALRALNTTDVLSVPCILGVGVDASPPQLHFLASPVCKQIPCDASLQLVLSLAAQLVNCLEAVHMAGFAHRDVRPSNIVMRDGADGKAEVVLVDWACAVVIRNVAVDYEGTVHYAAADILNALADDRRAKIVPNASHDLESLVYSVFGWARVASALLLDKEKYAAITSAWSDDVQHHSVHIRRLELARACDYSALRESFSAF
jgi:hypothetical protein